MKNVNSKFKSYSFWMSLLGAICIIIQTVLAEFNIAFTEESINSVITGICSVLVVLGVCTAPKNEESSSEGTNNDNNNN